MARRQVEIDGIRLSTTTTGDKGPTIVLCDSAGGDGSQWRDVVDLLEGYTCVTYARPGLGDSDPLPPEQAAIPRPARWLADQLHRLLRAAEVPPPYVVAGCSIGGFVADAFATAYPQVTAGIVQVDASPLTDIPMDAERTTVDDADGRGVLLSWKQSWRDAGRSQPAAELPAVVLTRDAATVDPEIIARYWKPLTPEEAESAWFERQQEWARRLHAVHIVADGAGHHINIDRPALVALAIRAVSRAARDSGSILLDPDALSSASGRRV